MADRLEYLTAVRRNRDLPEEWWAKADKIIEDRSIPDAIRMLSMWDSYCDVWRRYAMHRHRDLGYPAAFELGRVYARSLLANWDEEDMRILRARRQREMDAARPVLRQLTFDDTIGHIFRFL